MWTLYEVIRRHPPDFRVKYKFRSVEEGGRRRLPHQGYRADFSYAGDDIKKTGIYAIHPEFEDEEGNIILDDNVPVPSEGTARMWILFPLMRREVHVHRVRVGMFGYFMEGSRKVADAEIIEILGLYDNAKNLREGE